MRLYSSPASLTTLIPACLNYLRECIRRQGCHRLISTPGDSVDNLDTSQLVGASQMVGASPQPEYQGAAPVKYS